MTHWIIILPICIVNNADVDLIEKEERWSIIYIDSEKSYPYSYIFILFDSATKPAIFRVEKSRPPCQIFDATWSGSVFLTFFDSIWWISYRKFCVSLQMNILYTFPIFLPLLFSVDFPCVVFLRAEIYEKMNIVKTTPLRLFTVSFSC